MSFSPNATPVEAHTDGFTARLADEALNVEMNEHHASEGSARSAVEPYLNAWAVRHALLFGGRQEFQFNFVRSEIVDRDPPPPGTPQTVELEALVHSRGVISGPANVERGSYPMPPDDFALDADTLTLWQRWQGYTSGREPLQPMAYFCLTVLARHGGRSGAASRYGIAERVLSTLARLSTETGDETTARKAAARPKPATANETAWLEAVVMRIVRRAGEIAADPSAARTRITMADLPPL